MQRIFPILLILSTLICIWSVWRIIYVEYNIHNKNDLYGLSKEKQVSFAASYPSRFNFFWKEQDTQEIHNKISQKYQALLQERQAKIIKQKSTVLQIDNHIHRYVDPYISFNDPEYIPQDLVDIEGEYIINTKWYWQVREEVLPALQSMSEKFYKDVWEKMVIVSSFRSFKYQKGIKDRWCPDHLCAKAGHSEHQSGLAIDFWSTSTKEQWDNSETLSSYFKWLNENAHIFGFHNSYQNGVEIDGYAMEPWHWRYIWIGLATHLYEREITLGEYYYEFFPKEK